jgi:hypothetical protein
VSQLLPLGIEIPGVLLSRRRHDCNSVFHNQPVSFKTDELARIVRERTNALQLEIEKNLRADAIVSQVWLESQLLMASTVSAPVS